MSLTHKVIRRLGLGDAASRVLAPFSSGRASLPSPEEAHAFLEKLRSDRKSSCLCSRGPAFGTAEDVDIELILPVYNVERYLPACLGEMLGLVRSLSSSIGAPFLRVDFYVVAGRPLFGELTFYSDSGLGRFDPPEWDERIGQYLQLPEAAQEGGAR